MAIEPPRIQPVMTPIGAVLDDELRVRRGASAPPPPKSDSGAPPLERRVQSERRKRRDARRGSVELRARRDRRAASRLDIDA